VTIDVRSDFPIQWPVARTAASWLTFGFHENLEEAARIATLGMLDLMQREHGLARDDALALGSVVVDLRVTQIANKTLGVHAVLSDAALG
jgi:acetamidase/formamidase